MPFLDFVKSELPGDLNYIELDLSNPDFIHTPSKVNEFLGCVKSFFPERKFS